MNISPLNQKLLRELWRLRGQIAAIALVVASGVAILVMALSAIQALEDSAQAYYDRYRFADIFASVKRAPQSLYTQISAIPGVRNIDTRIRHYAVVDIDGFEEPVLGVVNSLPDLGVSRLNRLVLRRGRMVQPDRPNEVVLSEPFAEAHNFVPGDTLAAVLNGHRRRLQIVGIALSPEYIYSLGPGAIMPDDRRFGVMWMSNRAMEAAFDLKDAFNYVALSIDHTANNKDVMHALDLLLAPYGGGKAIAREDQISNWFVMNEIEQQKTMAAILPAIFLTVSLFLTQMVMARLIATERTEIGLLKAFGYSSAHIAWYYIKMVAVIAGMGVLLGWGLGLLLGHYNTLMYAEMFRFPVWIYRPSSQALWVSACISLAAALVGAAIAVRHAIVLPPAEAMQPPAPPNYRRNKLDRLIVSPLFDQPTRIVLRQILRSPIRASMTSLGIGMSVGLCVMALQWDDSLNALARINFFDAQKQDLSIALVEPRELAALHDVKSLPGIRRVEPMRSAAVTFVHGNRRHAGAITGLMQSGILQPLFDSGREIVVPLPSSGVVLSRVLATKLSLRVGQWVSLEFEEGERRTANLQITGVLDTLIGASAFIELGALGRVMGESPRFDTALVLFDEQHQADLFSTLKKTPRVSAVTLKRSAVHMFYDTLVKHLMVFITIFSSLAAVLAFGVAYNSARIALSERGRELATLRVLGFFRSEISYVLLGEVMLLVLVGLALGCLVGWGLVELSAAAFATELFRIPLVLEPKTFGLAAVIALTASIVSAAIVRRRVDRLDLIRVLKTRE